jgi:hypothetical protein
MLNCSFNTVPVAGDRFAEWWSAMDSDNVVDRDAPTPGPAPVPKKEPYNNLDEAFASSFDDTFD